MIAAAELPFLGVLGMPVAAAATLACIPSYRVSARVNAVASLITLISAASFLSIRPEPGTLLFIDDFLRGKPAGKVRTSSVDCADHATATS